MLLEVKTPERPKEVKVPTEVIFVCAAVPRVPVIAPLHIKLPVNLPAPVTSNS